MIQKSHIMKKMTNKTNDIDWPFENWSLVGLYMVMIFAALYHLCYTLPMYHMNRFRYGPLTEEHREAFLSCDLYTGVQLPEVEEDAVLGLGAKYQRKLLSDLRIGEIN